MANPTLELVDALRKAAKQLREGSKYAWGHHGSCNCGHLIQAATKFEAKEILKYAHASAGEWTEIAEDYCPVTNVPTNLLIKKLFDIGLTPTDIHNLEYLDNKKVLNELPNGFRWLEKNNRDDVVDYFETYANMLENKLISNIKINSEELFKVTNFQFV